MTLDELKKRAEAGKAALDIGTGLHNIVIWHNSYIGPTTTLKLLEMIALKDKALDIFRRALDESAPESMLQPAFDASQRADEIERSLGE